jgi:D-amino-acid oxidase
MVCVGCGVSGLSCGIRLLEAGFDVTIIARDLPPDTTSNRAAAIWYPYAAYPRERVLAWGRVTLDEFYRLMDVPDSGIAAVTVVELFDQPTPDPWWKGVVRRFAHTNTADLPPGYQDGYTIELPLIETPIYLRYLMQRFAALGGRIEQRTVSTLAELYGERRIIVNCAGLGAREVAHDSEVYPIRGQTIRVRRTPEMQRWWLDEEGHNALMYVIPRSDDCILGGTGQEGNWSLDADVDTAADILRRCQALEPALKDVQIIEHRVGLRPGRKTVRVELEPVGNESAVIHNYGHGGAGFTLSWGCADEVVQLAVEFAERHW